MGCSHRSAHWTWCMVVCMISGVSSVDPYFWHITDVHFDPHYHNWQNWEWNSCRTDVSQTQGSLGDYECDSSWDLAESSIRAMSIEGPEPKFILWTGDSPPHPKDATWLDKATTLQIVQNVTDLIKYYFNDTPVVVAIGNGDYWPSSQLPGEQNDIYDALYDMWRPWLGGDADIEETFKKGGYYTKTLATGMRVVVTNTNLYSTSNDVTAVQDDPGEQLFWLEEVLTQARQADQKVHLVMHMPPGVMERDSEQRWFREGFNTDFSDVISRNGDVIVASYAGHQHLDSFRVIYHNGEPVVPMFIAPSVTPWRGPPEGVYLNAHNPAIRKIVLDQSTHQLFDVEQWYLDLNLHGDDSIADAQWKELYTFRTVYDIGGVSAAELHSLAEEFKEWGSEKFHRYYDLNTVLTEHSSNGPCDNDCKVQHICAIQEVYFDKYDTCLEELDVSGSPRLIPSAVWVICSMWLLRHLVAL